MKPLICLVSPSHLSNNPRLVKEADALHFAGHRVHVVCGRYFPPIDHFDEAIIRASSWTVTIVDYTASVSNLAARLVHHASRGLVSKRPSAPLGVLARAQHRAHGALAKAATRVRASLYVGHTIGGLAAAAIAAKNNAVPYAFDAEDFHPAETVGSMNHPAERNAISELGRRLIPRAAHVSAASPLIGETYAREVGLRTSPLTVLNVFPRREAPPAPLSGSVSSGLPTRRLYWFSQTIGPGRGLEGLLPVLARLRTPVSLHLRGLPAPGYPDALRTAARQAGFTGDIEFLPLGHAAEMVRLAAGYDLGLSLEQPDPLNRDLCLTNKIFTYLLAGVPVAMTPTRAQRRLAPELAEAALLLEGESVEANVACLDALLSSSENLSRARARAWDLGQTRYNWEIEQKPLVSALSSLLAYSPAKTSS